MSSVVKWDDRIFMFAKGADNIIDSRLRGSQSSFAQEELHKLSIKGFRTLMVACKIISDEEWKSFKGSNLKQTSK
jgi:magnesium-transporting ATPase (P-type)